jgi:7-cyano-7-deazaguanine synthase
MKKFPKKAVVLFSGGLDSTTVLALAKEQGFAVYALSFDYGQRHKAELDAARKIAQAMGVVEHKVVKFDLTCFGGSALTDTAIEVPDYQETLDVPITYVPARNTIFQSYAMAYAEVLGAHDIFIGASAVDYSGYPDCRPEYFAAFNKMAQLATKATVHTPLINLSKAETVKMGVKLGVNYSQSVSCYRLSDDGLACGRCDSCVLRKKGFAEAGVEDPTGYV